MKMFLIFRFGFKMLELNGGEREHKRVTVILVHPPKEQEPLDRATRWLTKATFWAHLPQTVLEP